MFNNETDTINQEEKKKHNMKNAETQKRKCYQNVNM